MKTMHGLAAEGLRVPNKAVPSPTSVGEGRVWVLKCRFSPNSPSSCPSPRGGEGTFILGMRVTCVDTYALWEKDTTAWMHDSRDGGGRAASGTAAEEVEQRRERLPTTAWMQEVEQRRERLPRMRAKAICVFILLGTLG